MASYATLAQLKAYLPATGVADDPALMDLLERASRAIDTYCNRPVDAFAPRPNPETRTVYGTGTTRLYVPELLELVSVIGPGGPVPAALVRSALCRLNGQYLADEPWELGAPYQVTGRWGFATTPLDITEACLQLAVRWWRGKDEAFSGVVGAIAQDRTIIERDFPPAVRRLLAPYVLAAERDELRARIGRMTDDDALPWRW